MSNIIDSIQLSGTTYQIQGSGGGGNPTVELTEAQYDALVTAGTVQADTYYIITDAQAGDLSNYMTSAQTMSAITEATSGKVDSNVYTAYTASTDTAIQGKQDTLVSGTNIKTINNTSILGSGNIVIQGGGGKAVSAGRGISITTGETADTINCTLPFEIINSNSVTLGGFNNTTKGNFCYFGGHDNVINNYGTKHYIIGDSNKIGLSRYDPNFYNTLTVGEYNINRGGVVFGRYNSSSSDTLFIVGNGTNDNARHNAFEIRQNGDIYCSDGTNDVKLQDTITATAANTTALGGLKLVKLSQSAYDSLATKDNSTLYVIIN